MGCEHADRTAEGEIGDFSAGTENVGALGSSAQDGPGARAAGSDRAGLRGRPVQPDIAPSLKVTPLTVGKWRSRFLAKRLDGLLDEPRPSAPRRIQDEHVEQVLTRTLESTPRGATHWSTRSMVLGRDVPRLPACRPEWGAFPDQPRGSRTVNQPDTRRT